MKLLFLIFALFYPTIIFAGDRDETIKQIMEAQGLLQTFEQQLDFARKQSREQGRAMLDQALSSLNPNPEFKKRFEQALQEYMSEVETPWGAKEIVQIWAKFYGEDFTDKELDQLLTHYRSPLAQKEVIASRKAMVKFSTHFSEAGKPIAEKALSNFISKMKLIAKKCKCRRQKRN